MRATGSFVFLLVSACAALAVTPNVAQIDTITLERTACFGSCPVYKVAVRRDGTVTYDGEAFVKVTGHRSRKISSADFQQLANEVYRIGFFGFEDEYVLKEKHPDGSAYVISDQPSAIITVQAGKLRKRVRDYGGGAPASLRRLETLIDRISVSSAWVGKET